jgi:outer membrane protein assembly factor BamA
MSFLPIIGYSPALGFVAGAGVSAGLRTAPSNTTHLSSGLANISVTSKNQINFNVRSNIFLPNDKWILQGDWRLLIFAQPTSGLGIRFAEPEPFNYNGIEINARAYEQPMRFNYIRLYENVYKQIRQGWYAGMGINIDYHFSINDQSLDTLSQIPTLTSHYLYSRLNGFPQTAYTTAGFTFNILHDNRDNAINPSKGYFAQLSFRLNPTFIGSTKASSTLYYEYRTYLKLSEKSANAPLIAFWTWGQQLLTGNMPYLALPAVTWDMYNRSGRGYIQGRIRGENFWYGEVEYRFPITKNGLLGGVAFLNASSASNLALKQYLWDAFAPGYGIGLRVKMSKQTNTNITIDYGRGKNGSDGIYFNLQETF